MSEIQEHSEDLTTRILRRLRVRFYAGQDKFYFQELDMLKRAVFYPARYLDERSMRLPVEQYEKILLSVLKTVIEHGNLSAVRSPARYLLHAVQKHMEHHGEEYLEKAKRFDRALDQVMCGIRNAKPVEADATVPALAAAHRLLALQSGRKKKETQQEQTRLL